MAEAASRRREIDFSQAQISAGWLRLCLAVTQQHQMCRLGKPKHGA